MCFGLFSVIKIIFIDIFVTNVALPNGGCVEQLHPFI